MRAVQRVGMKRGENSERSLVERVCEFLEQYGIAHASEAESARAGEITEALLELSSKAGRSLIRQAGKRPLHRHSSM
jgi:hypothetical protein